ncbi:MAG: histone deacetylase [Holophagales bacterium]|nr:histone deacetylase [Holophagales bacterium]
MYAYSSDRFVLPLPEGHRFPMAKYRLTRERVAAELGSGSGGVVIEEPDPAADKELERAHHPTYVARMAAGRVEPREMRRIGFPWSPELVERSRRSVGATLAACRRASVDGAAVNLAGGTHHAFADRGEGFCVWNDAAVAARVLIAEGRARRVLVVDADVHQGNGTASIFAGDPAVFTLSIHGRRNFPFRKERSDLDVELDDGTSDEPYLEALAHALDRAVPLSAPDLLIYLAGADPFEGDRLGRLAVSKEGLARRDRLVLDRCRREGLPVAVAMAGGYAPKVEDIVDIHARTVALAAEHAAGSDSGSPIRAEGG